jgi:carbon starvation protein
MALIAAAIMEPGVYFAINSPVGSVGKEAAEIIAKINSWGFSVTAEQMKLLAEQVGEDSLFNRTGGAPSLAVGMASIFGNLFGNKFLAIWYHFVIMFEAVFILTTLDAGTRVCRFMIQDVLGNFSKTIGDTSHYPSIVITSFIAVASWAYFLYAGIIDPHGGVNMLWPLFGMANQILAGIALCLASVMLCKKGKFKYSFITLIPLCFLATSTLTAAYQKLTSEDIRIGILANINHLKNSAQTDLTNKLIFNHYAVFALTALFAAILIIVLIDTIRTILRHEKLL